MVQGGIHLNLSLKTASVFVFKAKLSSVAKANYAAEPWKIFQALVGECVVVLKFQVML